MTIHLCISLAALLSLSAVGKAQPANGLPSRQTTVGIRPSTTRTGPITGKSLSRKEAETATTRLLTDQRNQRAAALQRGWSEKSFTQGSHVLKFEYKRFGDRPKDGRSLFISMHGGGSAPAAVNDQQWKNQIGLYKPAEGVYVAPRAPTDTWNLWHEPHIDSLFDTLIQAAVLTEGVNPNKVYLMGYSAGGDGVYQLATRMTDRLAAAAMMAGHPNEVTPVNLRNIGFTVHMGALDKAYNRNDIAKRWGGLLDSLQTKDPMGYKHLVQLHEGRGHWMQREDTVAVSWMMKFRRNPIPAKVVWKQDDVHHRDFYWLAVPAGQAKTGAEVVASYQGNTIKIEKNECDTLLIRLNDGMMLLDKPVQIIYNGKPIFAGRVTRTLQALQRTIAGRNDPGLVFSAELKIIKPTDANGIYTVEQVP